MRAKKKGFKGKAESCEECPFPKLNKRNLNEIEIIDMIRASLLGLNLDLEAIFILYGVPGYRRLELLKKTLNLQIALNKENGRKS